MRISGLEKNKLKNPKLIIEDIRFENKNVVASKLYGVNATILYCIMMYCSVLYCR